jgi:hypothetical protein
MPFDMRWFQIIYLVVATYFVGDSLSRVGSLRKEARDIRCKFAWSSREVSKGMLEDMQSDEHDDKIDQYEYVVASLLALNKVNAEDMKPIMDQFRTLARGKEFICLESDVPLAECDTMQSDDY